LAADVAGSFIVTTIIGFIAEPTDMEVLVKFYSNVRPFGFWKPVREEAVQRGLVAAKDKMPSIDALNGILSAAFQITIALIPFYAFLRMWSKFYIWLAVGLALVVVLYFTWYKNLPAADEI
jgi:fatty acid desaturase